MAASFTMVFVFPTLIPHTRDIAILNHAHQARALEHVLTATPFKWHYRLRGLIVASRIQQRKTID